MASYFSALVSTGAFFIYRLPPGLGGDGFWIGVGWGFFVPLFFAMAYGFGLVKN